MGQLLFVQCNRASAVQDVAAYHPGGLILFAADFQNQTKQQVRATLQSYQKAARTPLLIGVDEEGGKVNRVSLYKAFRSEPFLSPQALFAQGGFPRITSDTLEKADLLKDLGINVNLAPVCDVSTSDKNYIYPRTFGQNAAQTAVYVRTVVEAMNQRRFGAVLKHFPGYGDNADTHQGGSKDTRPYSVFETSDFLPFQAGIGAGAGGVMVSHNLVTAMDKDRPASLSPAVHRILRETLGFSGVIMTDSLEMKAIQNVTGANKAAVAAIQAGNDMAILRDCATQYPALLAAAKSGVIPLAQIDASVTRILLWKIQLGLL